MQVPRGEDSAARHVVWVSRTKRRMWRRRVAILSRVDSYADLGSDAARPVPLIDFLTEPVPNH